MKINVVLVVIAIAIAALLAYGLYSLSNASNNAVLLAVGSFIGFAATLSTALGFKADNVRASTNVKVASMSFFGLFLIANLIFTFVHFGTPFFVVINGLLLLGWLLSVYSISNSKQ